MISLRRIVWANRLADLTGFGGSVSNEERRPREGTNASNCSEAEFAGFPSGRAARKLIHSPLEK